MPTVGIPASACAGFAQENLPPQLLTAVRNLQASLVAQELEARVKTCGGDKIDIVKASDSQGRTLLHHCAEELEKDYARGDQVLGMLILDGADVAAANRSGETPLTVAVHAVLECEQCSQESCWTCPRLAAIQRLLEARACADTPDRWTGETPLMEAICCGDGPLCQLLLHYRANPASHSVAGSTAQDLAASFHPDRPDLLTILRQAQDGVNTGHVCSQPAPVPAGGACSTLTSSREQARQLLLRSGPGMSSNQRRNNATEEAQEYIRVFRAAAHEGDAHVCRLLLFCREELSRELSGSHNVAGHLPGVSRLLSALTSSSISGSSKETRGVVTDALAETLLGVTTAADVSVLRLLLKAAEKIGPAGLLERALLWLDSSGAGLLHHCALAPGPPAPREASLRLLLAAGATGVNMLSNSGETPLTISVRAVALEKASGSAASGDPTLLGAVAAMLDARANPDATSSPESETPLMEAASVGDAKLCQLLLEKRSDPLWATSHGITAFDYARKHPNILDLLHTHRRNLSSPTKVDASENATSQTTESSSFCQEGKHTGPTIPQRDFGPEVPADLLEAVMKPHPPSVRRLLKDRPNAPEILQMQDSNGFTLMHLVLMMPPSDQVFATMALLIKNRAQIDAHNVLGESALHLATRAALDNPGDPNGAWLRPFRSLLERKADPNEADMSGETPLTEAACGGNLCVCKHLVEARADPSLKSVSGLSALDFAETANFVEVAALLREAIPPCEAAETPSPEAAPDAGKQDNKADKAAASPTPDTAPDAGKQANKEDKEAPSQRSHVAPDSEKEDNNVDFEARAPQHSNDAIDSMEQGSNVDPELIRGPQHRPRSPSPVQPVSPRAVVPTSRPPVEPPDPVQRSPGATPSKPERTSEAELFPFQETEKFSNVTTENVETQPKEPEVSTSKKPSDSESEAGLPADVSAPNEGSDCMQSSDAPVEKPRTRVGELQELLMAKDDEPRADEDHCEHQPDDSPDKDDSNKEVKPKHVSAPVEETCLLPAWEGEKLPAIDSPVPVLRSACSRAGLSVAWCSDQKILHELLRGVHVWQQASVRHLKRECALFRVPVDGLVEKKEIIARLCQVVVWSSMPMHELRAECHRSRVQANTGISLATTGTRLDKPELINRLIAKTFKQSISVETEKNNDKRPITRASTRSTSAMPRQQNTRGSKAGGSRTRSASARPQSQPTMREKTKTPEFYFMGDDEEKLAAFGPRVRSYLENYPGYSGEMPPEDAEELWTDQELYNFFFSSGFIKPKKKNQEPKVTKEMLEEYYKTLGLNFGNGITKVRQAYRQLALQYHPDKNLNNQSATAKFQGIKEAYTVICRELQAKQAGM